MYLYVQCEQQVILMIRYYPRVHHLKTHQVHDLSHSLPERLKQSSFSAHTKENPRRRVLNANRLQWILTGHVVITRSRDRWSTAICLSRRNSLNSLNAAIYLTYLITGPWLEYRVSVVFYAVLSFEKVELEHGSMQTCYTAAIRSPPLTPLTWEMTAHLAEMIHFCLSSWTIKKIYGYQ